MKNKPHFWNSFRNFYLCFLIIFLSDTMLASDLQVHNIPDSLKKQANSVVRYYRLSINISPQHEMHMSLEWAITVFNPSGNAHIDPVVGYGPSEKISVFEASVFDGAGALIKKFRSSDIQDVHAATQGSLFIDYRVKHLNYTPIQYPYTFVFKLVKKSKNTAFIPIWMPISFYYQSVQQSSFQLNYPEEWTLRASEKNFEDFLVVKNDTKDSYFTEIKNRPAVAPEYLSPLAQNFLPMSRLSLNHISLEGIQGKVDNWSDFGNWYRVNMLSDQSQLSDKTKQELETLTSGISDPLRKARLVYEYMQSRTRYVNVAIGIGGWKPMTVAEVDRLGYGDCKALSFYTIALLEAVGVPAAYSIIYAGENTRSIDTTLFSVQGNHIIVYVPLPDTTVWLETTNQQIPFGYLGSFTDNRNAICLTKNGTQLVNTITYPDSINIQYTESKITIDENGSLWSSATISSKGLMYDNRSYLLLLKQDEREEYYRNEYGHLQSITFGTLKFEADKSAISFNEKAELTATAYGTISGNRMFVNPNVFHRIKTNPPRYAQRKHPFEILRGQLIKDAIQINLPEGYTIESLPQDKFIEGPFGYYKTSIVQVSDQLIQYERTLLMNSGWYLPGQYEQYYQFIREVSRHDAATLVLKTINQ
jgi:hypothetical protein